MPMLTSRTSAVGRPPPGNWTTRRLEPDSSDSEKLVHHPDDVLRPPQRDLGQLNSYRGLEPPCFLRKLML